MGIENFEPTIKYNSVEGAKEKFLVLENEQMIEIYKEGIKKALTYIKLIKNELGPVAAVICTESSGVPFGYALKAGLKELNDDGLMPKFLRINVKPFKNQINLIRQGVPLTGEYKKAEAEFKNSLLKWKEKINDLDLKDKNIFILDEFTYTGNTSFSVRYLLEKSGIGKEQVFSLPDNIATNYPVWKFDDAPESRKGANPTETKNDDQKVGIVKGKEKREKAQNLIRDMEILGKLAAKELCQT